MYVCMHICREQQIYLRNVLTLSFLEKIAVIIKFELLVYVVVVYLEYYDSLLCKHVGEFDSVLRGGSTE